MSSDLKDSAKSIPKGTFAAIGVGYVIYMLLPILLTNRADAVTLIEDPLILRKISYWGGWYLIELADNLTHNRGLLTVSTLLVDHQVAVNRVDRLEAHIREYVAKAGVQALVRVTANSDPFEGSKRLFDNYGLGS